MVPVTIRRVGERSIAEKLSETRSFEHEIRLSFIRLVYRRRILDRSVKRLRAHSPNTDTHPTFRERVRTNSTVAILARLDSIPNGKQFPISNDNFSGRLRTVTKTRRRRRREYSCSVRLARA